MSAKKVEMWLRGLIAATISGGAGGILTGLAAIGIDPQHFNLTAGWHQTLKIGLAAALINAIIGVAGYLQKSPLPEQDQ
jgi:Zn-dependent protease